jgi:hypothetical protein
MPRLLIPAPRKVVRLSILFLTLLLTASTALGQSGALFYVSTSGSDSNAGTLRSPWRTIQHAANSVTAGATVYVMGGVYHESVSIPVSGTSGNNIIFQSYPGQTAIVDGTGVSVSGTQGLFNIVGQSYVVIDGFEIQNYKTGNANLTPAGIWVTGLGCYVQLLNNLVHNITTTSEKNGNAFGIAVYGTETTPIDHITISGNQVYSLKTGNSESVNVDGNVTNFSITNNIVHDNDNIGIDAIGFEGVGPNGLDQARDGEISGNTVYNISGKSNAGEGNSYDADGLYCDGCANVTMERNLIYATDLGIEVASEHGGHDGSYVTVRNNVIYNSNTVGISIGGYASGKGGTDHCVIVNNTLYNNNVKNQGAEFQIQWHSDATNIFENNLVYARTQNVWIYSYVSASNEPTPATVDYNVWYSTKGYVKGTSITWHRVSNYTSYANYQKVTGNDAHSPNANPLFVNLGATPPDYDIAANSPAVNAGSLNLGTSYYGTTDFVGHPRLNGSAIDIGAYESAGVANSLAVTLTSAAYVLSAGQSTTLTATVSANPGDGGAPTGTINFMLQSTSLATITLMPTDATDAAASLPLNASQLALGANTLTAVYSGDSHYGGATSAPITITLQ